MMMAFKENKCRYAERRGDGGVHNDVEEATGERWWRWRRWLLFIKWQLFVGGWGLSSEEEPTRRARFDDGDTTQLENDSIGNNDNGSDGSDDGSNGSDNGSDGSDDDSDDDSNDQFSDDAFD
jgi:hypothetical protein